MKKIILLIVLAVAASGCVQQDIYSCESDADCISVDAGCCGCTQGGKATAITKNFADQWNANLTQSCKQIACIQSISDDPSCFAETRCIDKRCTLK